MGHTYDPFSSLILIFPLNDHHVWPTFPLDPGPRSTPEVAGVTSSPSAHLINVMMPTAWRTANSFGNKWNNVVTLQQINIDPARLGLED